ncbi:MAG: ATP-binding cassette domain-containing protein [Alphaproteobacteria bacterium]|jgi:osmoprotectant transport system ATP-binding protein|nr:ATP-binding cassette domain-containing protein [Alphaproteobacteria bacterium]MDP6517104.1 ATP-binding cassette domain-containing protein [Alphaproteobacteria bacterium]
MFDLKNVSKKFGDLVAIDDLDLDVEGGRTTVFIGPSGCGKSTLIRVLMGLIPPDLGMVRFEGTEVNAETAPLLRRKMGYVIQGGGLFPHLTAGENAALMARFLGRPRAETAARLIELATLVQLPEDALGRYPAQISGGQRQRVALMRALMLDPDVLLLDEPFGALDPIVRYRLQTDLRDIFRELGKTVVMVTHDIAEAGFFGDLLVLLRDGQVIQKGPIEQLVHAPAEAYVDEFISAQRTLLDCLEEVPE